MVLTNGCVGVLCSTFLYQKRCATHTWSSKLNHNTNTNQSSTVNITWQDHKLSYCLVLIWIFAPFINPFQGLLTCIQSPATSKANVVFGVATQAASYPSCPYRTFFLLPGRNFNSRAMPPQKTTRKKNSGINKTHSHAVNHLIKMRPMARHPRRAFLTPFHIPHLEPPLLLWLLLRLLLLRRRWWSHL